MKNKITTLPSTGGVFYLTYIFIRKQYYEKNS